MKQWLFLGGVLLCGHQVLAQQQLPVQPPVTLTIEVEDAKLIVQMLGAIGCQNVQQLIVCERARDLLKKIQDQAKAQEH